MEGPQDTRDAFLGKERGRERERERELVLAFGEFGCLVSVDTSREKLQTHFLHSVRSYAQNRKRPPSLSDIDADADIRPRPALEARAGFTCRSPLDIFADLVESTRRHST